MDPVLRLTVAGIVFVLAALIGVAGGVFLILLANHDNEEQSARRSAPTCSAVGDALAGRNCVIDTSGMVTRKYLDGAFPAATVSLPSAGKVVRATFRNTSGGRSAWSALPTGSPVPVRLWRGSVTHVNGVWTIDDPDHLQNTGAAPGGVLMIVGALVLGPLSVAAILGERRRYQALGRASRL